MIQRERIIDDDDGPRGSRDRRIEVERMDKAVSAAAESMLQINLEDAEIMADGNDGEWKVKIRGGVSCGGQNFLITVNKREGLILQNIPCFWFLQIQRQQMRKIKNKIKKELGESTHMSELEEAHILDIWSLGHPDRWRLYRSVCVRSTSTNFPSLSIVLLSFFFFVSLPPSPSHSHSSPKATSAW